MIKHYYELFVNKEITIVSVDREDIQKYIEQKRKENPKKTYAFDIYKRSVKKDERN